MPSPVTDLTRVSGLTRQQYIGGGLSTRGIRGRGGVSGGVLVEYGMMPGSQERLRNLLGQISSFDAVGLRHAIEMTGEITNRYEDAIKRAFAIHTKTGASIQSLKATYNGLHGQITMGGGAEFVLTGTAPHDITPSNGFVLRFEGTKNPGEGWVYRESVSHPGSAADNFLFRAERLMDKDIISALQIFSAQSYRHLRVMPPNSVP